MQSSETTLRSVETVSRSNSRPGRYRVLVSTNDGVGVRGGDEAT